MLEPVQDTELTGVCQGLGRINEATGRYEKEPDAKDELVIIRIKIREGLVKKDFEVLEDLGKLNVVSSDLIPLLKDYCLDESVEAQGLFMEVLQVLNHLTYPIILLFDEKVPVDKDVKTTYLKLINYTYQYKLAFGASLKCWLVLAQFVTKILQKGSDEDRSPSDHKIMDGILVLIRNLLFIPLDANTDKNISGEANPHDRIIEMMDKSGISDLILLMVTSGDEYRYSLVILEIIHLMMREQNAEYLAKNYDPNKSEDERYVRSSYEKQKDDEELKLLVSREKAKSQQSRRTFKRFKDVTYEVKNLKSLGDKDTIIHHLPQNLELITFNTSKQGLRKPKNRRELQDSSFTAGGDGFTIHKSTPNIQRHLSKFCHEFLNSYNSIMVDVKHMLSNQKEEYHDESYYLWSASFFMEFNRHIKPDVTLVTQTYSVESMHYFHTLILDYAERLRVERGNYIPWSRRLHYALKSYRELIFTLGFCDSSASHQFVDVTKELKQRIFYDDDYRELIWFLLRDFNSIRMTKRYLVDLVQTNHVFLRLLKSYCIINDNLVVAKKSKGHKTKLKKSSKKKSKKKNKKPLIVNTEESWEEVEVGLRAALDGLVVLPTAEMDEDVLPIDSTVDYEPDIQKLAIIRRIQRLLSQQKAGPAVALFRNARDSWIDDPLMPFGSHDASPEDEEESLKQIYLADLPEDEKDDEDDEPEDKKEENDVEMNDDDIEDDKIVTKKNVKTVGFLDVFKKYCHPKIVAAYCLVLKDFDKNSLETNHCVIKFLHRISFECELYGMMFQASLFRIFQKILKTPASDDMKELIGFSKFILRKFFEILPKNDMLLVELLFWKNGREAVQLEFGYDDLQPDEATKSKRAESPSDFVVDDDEDNDENNHNRDYEPPVSPVASTVSSSKSSNGRNKDEGNFDVEDIDADSRDVPEERMTDGQLEKMGDDEESVDGIVVESKQNFEELSVDSDEEMEEIRPKKKRVVIQSDDSNDSATDSTKRPDLQVKDSLNVPLADMNDD